MVVKKNKYIYIYTENFKRFKTFVKSKATDKINLEIKCLWNLMHEEALSLESTLSLIASPIQLAIKGQV